MKEAYYIQPLNKLSHHELREQGGIGVESWHRTLMTDEGLQASVGECDNYTHCQDLRKRLESHSEAEFQVWGKTRAGHIIKLAKHVSPFPIRA